MGSSRRGVSGRLPRPRSSLAAIGFVFLVLRDRRALLLLVIAFGPYLVFDLLFQETITTRYALPLVVPVGYLAMRGASLLPRRGGVVAALALIAASAYVSDRTMYGFSTMEAPAFRMLGDMHDAVQPEGAAVPTTPALAMHRREYFDFRRPFQWVGNRLPQFSQRLATPPKHEWLEVVKYWNSGGREPVWFIADPLRSDLALFKYAQRPVIYRWPFSPTILMGGARPSEMDWHRIESPDWYLGEGWALTPETAGTAREDRKGPGYGPIQGWIRRNPGPGTLMVGGRNLAGAGPAATLQITVDGTSVLDESIPPGFFLRMIPLPSTAGEGGYAPVTVTSDSPELAIEQFDAQPAGRVVYGFGDGWNEQEYNPTTGVLWRWSSDRAAIRVRAEGNGLALTLRGEIEAASTSHVTVKAGDAVAAAFDVERTFSRTVIIPRALLSAPETVLTIESSAFYVPAAYQVAVRRSAHAGSEARGVHAQPDFLARHRSELPNGLSNARQPPAFDLQRGSQREIDRHRRHADLLIRILFGRQPPPPLDRAGERHRRQENRVGVRDPIQCETSAGHQPREARPAVAAHLMAEHRVVPAQHLHRRDVDHQPAARAGHPVQFANRRLFDSIGKGIQNIERSDDIEGGVRKRDSGDGGTGQARAAGLLAVRQSARREIETERTTVPPKQFKVVSSAAAAIENPEIGASTRGAFQQRAHEVSKAPKPEVTLFGECSRAEKMIHSRAF